jgi:hypothetical protein
MAWVSSFLIICSSTLWISANIPLYIYICIHTHTRERNGIGLAVRDHATHVSYRTEGWSVNVNTRHRGNEGRTWHGRPNETGGTAIAENSSVPENQHLDCQNNEDLYWDIKPCSSLKSKPTFRRNILSSGLKNNSGKKQEWKQMASRANQNITSHQHRIGKKNNKKSWELLYWCVT